MKRDYARTNCPERSPRSGLPHSLAQFPLGGTLSVQRRIDLAAYAAATECLLIEDDYESEFRFEGLP
jgi:GntR family transcriptional regulator/MocR family aminotransferase